MNKPIIIYRTARIGALLYEDFMMDNLKSNVVAFTADKEWVKDNSFMGIPLIDFEKVNEIYPPECYDMIVAVSNRNMRERESLFTKARNKGYSFANFISKNAILYDKVYGVNNIICSNVYIGPNCKIENNVVIRPKTYIGHDSYIGNHVYISPGCNIGGYCKIKDLSFIGIGSTIIDRIMIERETLIGAGSVVIKNTEEFSAYVGNPCRKIKEHKDTGIIV